jgi:hypothetical protein
MIAIDADVLAIYHIFKRDARFTETERFMQQSQGQARGVSIFGLLELCGLMATAQQPENARRLFAAYIAAPDMTTLYPHVDLSSSEQFWATQNAELLRRIMQRVRLGDAATIWTIESANSTVLVTWNAKHYQGKTSVLVQTPEQWLQANALAP